MEKHSYTNDLIHETSPYLLQHAHNPVDWKPWGQEALRESDETNKLMVISIGYAACHWCHVMEKESFEDSAVAAIMNANYISIKVDREERPDVDQTYINAVQLMTGNAGWPLNVITLPDGRPIFGGTYFRKDDWMQALEQVQALYVKDPEKLVAYAGRLEEGIKSLDLVTLNTSDVNYKNFDFQPLLNRWKQQLDTIDGGNKGAPKFMMPNLLHTLLKWGHHTEDPNLIDHVHRTLEKMAFGGIYDQVGGGFSRYSTDDRWHVPHFEKMLYDNAQLVSLYSEAYRLEPNPLYQQIVTETLDFVAASFTDNEGVFYSSLDADSHTHDGHLEEGAYYTFTIDELKEVITSDWEVFSSYYNINDFGLWKEENKYVLIRNKSDIDIANQFDLQISELKAKVASWKNALATYRDTREKPRLDDKSLTSWNALMIQGYLDAFKSFGSDLYLEKALTNAAFIKNRQLQSNGALFHSYKKGKSTINGYLEDYASTIQAFLSLYEVTFDKQWLELSDSLATYAIDNFFDQENQMFYFSSKEDEAIITRNFDYRDNVIPSSNSIMAYNLFRLSHHMYNQTYGDIALQMLKNVQSEFEKYPQSFSNWISLLANYRFQFYEVVVAGMDAREKAHTLASHYLPNVLLAGTTKAANLPLLENRFVPETTMIYVCVNNSCKLPVTEVEEALKLMK